MQLFSGINTRWRQSADRGPLTALLFGRRRGKGGRGVLSTDRRHAPLSAAARWLQPADTHDSSGGESEFLHDKHG